MSEKYFRIYRSLSREGDYLGKGCLFQFPTPKLELEVMDTRNILKIEVQLQHVPGTLGRFARLLAEHKVNVIYMTYHEDVSETSANFSIATQDPGEVDTLLKDMNKSGYYYSLFYRERGRTRPRPGILFKLRFRAHIYKRLSFAC